MKYKNKEHILESFQKMDAWRIDDLLDDNKTYQEATKDAFIEKLEAVFLQFKKCGDTFLEIHEGTCN
jgi:hypothetical protein